MKKLKSLQVFCIAVMLIMAMTSMAFAGAQDFQLINSTGHEIHVVNVSPSSSSDWQNDILGSQILGNGQYCNVQFASSGHQYWDLQATFNDGSSLVWNNIDLLSVSTVTLNGDGTANFQ